MNNNISRLSNRFMVAGGIFFLIIGVAGIIAPKISSIYDVNNLSYRLLYVEKENFEPQLDIVELELPAIIEEQNEDKKDRDLFVNSFSSYIHLQSNKKVEEPNIPTRIVIPSIKLVAPVISADFHNQQIGDDYFGQWEAPDRFAAGWHPDSALLGAEGNTVINGHHNVHGKVFENLLNVNVGDKVYVYAGENIFPFIVNNTMILPELFVDVETRLQNARWLTQSDDERLTIVTCWPASSNTHRLIVVAEPLRDE
ncbi:MAG: sortase [Bacteroidales bacterium]